MKNFKSKFFEQFDELTNDVIPSVAIIAGGFKPPTKGHYKAFEYLLQDANEGIIFIGKKERDGITPEQSKAIWEVYVKYLPKPTKVEISNITPVKSIYDYADSNTEKKIVVGAGSKDEDIKRFDYFIKNVEKYPLVNVVKIPMQEEGISGSMTREKILRKDPDAINYFVPDVVSQSDKELIAKILNI